jgi:hypothetical protein
MTGLKSKQTAENCVSMCRMHAADFVIQTVNDPVEGVLEGEVEKEQI